MKLQNVLIVAVLSGIAFTSCKDNQRGSTDDDVRIEMDRTTTSTDARTDQGMTNDNNVSARLQRNQNLSTFNEGLTRNQIDMQRGTSTTTASGTQTRTGTTTGTQTGTGTTTGTQTATGTTTGTQTATGTQTGTGTGTTTGTQTGTTAGQGMQGQNEYTIFAPSNDAYNSLTAAQRNQFMDNQNRDLNTASMNYLMVNQRITRDQLKQQIERGNGTHTIKTMQGENLTATMDGENIVLRDGAGNQARITESDNEGSDGVIHVIDKVLMPMDPKKNEAATRGSTGTTRAGTGTTTGGTSTGGTTTGGTTTDRNTGN